MTKDQIRDVIAQWRARIAKCRHISENQAALGNTWLARSWDEEADTIADCVRQLEALLTGVWICKIDGTHHRDGPCDCAALAERPQPQEAQNEMVDCDSVRPADAGDARVGVVGDVARDAFREGFAAGRHQAQQIARDRPLVAKEDAMTQQSDRERLDAIRQQAKDNSTRHLHRWLALYGADVTWLLDRLAALLSLQTATQWQPIATVPSDADFIMAAWPCTGAASGFDVGEVSREGPTTWMNFYGLCVPTYWMPLPKPPAALLPDPAGTQLTNDDDDHARVDSERLTDRPRTAPTERR